MALHTQTIDELFAKNVRWISVMDNRNTETGLMAFGYPEKTYGYDTCKVIGMDEIPAIVAACEQRGYELYLMSDTGETRRFVYRYPGAKWWTELATVKDGVLIPAE